MPVCSQQHSSRHVDARSSKQIRVALGTAHLGGGAGAAAEETPPARARQPAHQPGQSTSKVILQAARERATAMLGQRWAKSRPLAARSCAAPRPAASLHRPCVQPVTQRPTAAWLPQQPQQQQQLPCSRQQQRRPRLGRCRAASPLLPEPAAAGAIPQDVQLEPHPDAAAKQVEYDEASKTIRIPLNALAGGDGRRTKLVMFTCNKCGGRSARLTNPLAWQKGAVFAQCQHCGVWHTLAAAPHIIEEIRYDSPEWQEGGSAGAGAAAAAAAAGSQESQQSADTGAPLPAGLSGGDGDDEATSAPAPAADPGGS